VCNSLIQLIENVYADLDLEANWDHPHVAGWMGMFRRWARQPAFRRTWNVSETTYADRLRNFYNDRLRGRPMRLPRGFVAYREAVAGKTPQDSLDHYTGAIRVGASVIELEVRKLASGELVVCPDSTIEKKQIEHWTSTGRTPNGVQLQGGIQLLTLEGCLHELHNRTRLCVALKTKGIEGAALKALQTRGWSYDDYTISSDDPPVIHELRQACSDVALGLHVTIGDLFTKAFDDFLLSGADYLAPHADIVTPDQLRRAREEHVPLVPWVVNEADQLRLFLAHDAVAGVISNNVELALKIRGVLS